MLLILVYCISRIRLSPSLVLQVYSDAKKCWAPNGLRPALSEIPQLRELYIEAETRLARLEAFLALMQVWV